METYCAQIKISTHLFYQEEKVLMCSGPTIKQSIQTYQQQVRLCDGICALCKANFHFYDGSIHLEKFEI